MNSRNVRATFCGYFLLLSALFTSAAAQKLTFRNFSASDGLANNRVNRIFQDRKGFIWFATSDGLSRFDGYEFATYDVSDGLPSIIINDIAEDRDSRLWLAANDRGIAVRELGDKAFRSFEIEPDSYLSNKVNRIIIDSRNTLWCLTDDGVYSAPISDKPTFTKVFAYDKPVDSWASRAIFEDKEGSIWFVANNRLIRSANGLVSDHGRDVAADNSLMTDAIVSADGRIYVLYESFGLYEYVPSKSEWRRVPLPEDFKNGRSLIETDDGALWIGDQSGLVRIYEGQYHRYLTDAAPGYGVVFALTQDIEGNLWAGTTHTGVWKTTGLSLTSYPSDQIGQYLGASDLNGRAVIFGCEREGKAKCYAQDAVTGSRLPIDGLLNISNSFSLIRRDDDLSVVIGFTNGARLTSAKLTSASGTASELVRQPPKDKETATSTAYYLAGDGNIWTASKGAIDNGSETFQIGHEVDLLAGTSNGEIWWFRRGTYSGRVRANGAVQNFSTSDGLPGQDARSAFGDTRGWLWIGTRFNGVTVCKDLSNDLPSCEVFDRGNSSLGSDIVWSINEDARGRMYFGTEKGVHRFDPISNKWDSIATAVGLNGSSISHISRDRAGNMWFTLPTGLIRLSPDLERDLIAPPIFLTRLTVSGVERQISENAAQSITGLELESSQSDLTLDFVALRFANTDSIRYQYKLDDGRSEWSEPSTNRSLTFANLAAGDYRFQIRAVTTDGVTSPEPAILSFKIFPPIYLRWWFLTLLGLGIAVVAFAIVRARTSRLLEIERTRTAIATDLHDDIGSNLSKISVLSEVVKMQLERDGKADHKMLSSMAEISRDSVSSMRDIVWAIDPKRDSVQQLIRKMREHAEEIFLPLNIALDFPDPEESHKIKLPMDVRRELFLIFKEVTHNIAKHSGARKVNIRLVVESSRVVMDIKDDGCGFDQVGDESISGNGLNNINARTKGLRGEATISSFPDNGTHVKISVPQRIGRI